MLLEKEYGTPSGYEGFGSDIGWCSRPKGRKKCALCFHIVEQEVWAKEWNWFYLLRWLNHSWWNMETFAHFRQFKQRYETLPINYRSTGLKDFELKKLLKKGCKDNKKCKCVNIVQRAFWYCPECYITINTLAKYERVHPHDLMLSDRNELKEKVLILRLSGSI